jgi:hypothetical protein
MQVIRFIVGVSLLSAMYTHMAHSEEPWWMSFDKVYEPNILFSKIDLEIKIVENANTECKKYASDINFEVEHCALQYKPKPNDSDRRKCVLIMQRNKLTMGDLGHEVRHCFEGDWHAYRPTKRIKR